MERTSNEIFDNFPQSLTFCEIFTSKFHSVYMDCRRLRKLSKIGRAPVADLGFPRGGGANSRGGGAPTYDFAKFSQKLHEFERIWTPGGTRPKFYYVDLPLGTLKIAYLIFKDCVHLVLTTHSLRLILHFKKRSETPEKPIFLELILKP